MILIAAASWERGNINRGNIIIKVILASTLIALIALFFLILGWLIPPAACQAAESKPKLSAVASIFPLQEMAKAVGGERVRVDLLLPPGAEPHTWEPKPSDIIALTKADIFIYLGAGMEPWVVDLLKGIARSNLRVIKASEGLLKLEQDTSSLGSHKAGEAEEASAQPTHDTHEDNGHHHSAKQGNQQHSPKAPGSPNAHEGANQHSPDHQLDPHLWLDFSYAQIMVSNLAKAFSELDPAGAKFYSQNALNYQKKLAELDQKYQQGLKNCRYRKIFFGGHAAFSYLARRYQLEQIPLYGISPDAEPSPKRLAEITELARREQVTTIFFEELVSDRLARILAQEVGAGTLVLNPGANLTSEQLKAGVSFLSLMEKNLETLRKGLLCE